MKSSETGLSTTMKDITQQQIVNNQQLSAITEQMAKLMIAMDSRIASLEKLISQRVTVSAAQARAISSAVQTQARALCEKNGFPYKEHGEAFRRAMWRDFKTHYNVTDVHDLPASYYNIAIDYISGWASFALVRKLRDKRGL